MYARSVPFASTGELCVDGEKIDEVEMPQMHISTYSLAETFDVGRDTGTQVSNIFLRLGDTLFDSTHSYYQGR